MSTFSQLRQLLNSSLDELEVQLHLAKFPDLDTISLHPTDQPSYNPTKELFHARQQAIACLGQLTDTIQSPAERLLSLCMSVQIGPTIVTIIDADVPDLLPKDDAAGLAIADLAAKCKMNDVKLGKLMRSLATQSIFREVTEGVFAHNRASLLLVKGSSIRDYVDWSLWYALPTLGNVSSVYRSPETANDWTPLASPFASHYDYKSRGFANLFDHQKADFPHRLAQFQRAMGGLGSVSAKGTILDYPWSQLPKGSTIVDVGGGQGALLIEIMKAFPGHFRGVIQERPEVVPFARKNFENNLPEAFEMVQFEDHDFFGPQTQKGNNVIFLLRWIIHNYSDEIAVKILTRLREVSQPDTRILIVDSIMQLATPASSSSVSSNTSGQGTFPAPLLTNGGHANLLSSRMDLTMMGLLSATERTETEFENLLFKAGLVCKKFWHVRGPHGIIEAALP